MKWLTRELITGPYLCLCVSEAEFLKAMRHCRITRDVPQWVSAGSNATTHTLETPDGGMAAIVCIQATDREAPIQVAALLVHEAVHVWQNWRESIGEHKPSSEFEAYGIQQIAQRLMQAYADGLDEQSQN